MSGSNSKLPLVSIGIPTYNRAAGLRAALESALTQDYANLEIIVSDNASTDDTPALMESFARNDPRVHYVRHPKNLGPTANFEAARERATGPYFIWLADDDWFGPGYVRRCVEELEANPELIHVCGKVSYYKQGQYFSEGQKIDLLENSNSRRVIQYFRQVGDNGTFYGLMRREPTRKIRLPNTLGGDWIFMAAIAFLGKVRTLTDITLHRDFTWDETSIQRYAASMGLPAFQARHPYLSIANSAYQDIRRGTFVYDNLAGAGRWWLACRAWRILCRRYRVRLPQLLKASFFDREPETAP